MRIPQTKLQKIKAAVHGVQTLLIFIAGCLTLAVMTKPGSFGGETGFFFALCFLSIPGLIYQVMVPIWSRAWRFANVYAYATIDVIYSILWFAAAVAVAVWNANGIAKGAKDGTKKDDTKSNSGTSKRDSPSPSCDTFAYGDASKCNVSKASVGFGILLCFAFAASAGIAIHFVFVYKRTGVIPGGNNTAPARVNHSDANDDPNKDAWSTNVDELDHDHSHQRSDDHLEFRQDMEEDEQGLLHHQSSHQRLDSRDDSGLAHPGRPLSYEPGHVSPLYADQAQGYNDAHHAPSALSPTTAYDPQESYHGGDRLHFPQGNYSGL